MELGSFKASVQDIRDSLKWFNEWRSAKWPPKNIKDKIGIVIAIRTEEDKERKRLRNSLIAQLSEYLDTTGLQQRFNVIEYSPRLADTIADRTNAARYLKISRAHFIIYGSLAQRQHEGHSGYDFHLNGVVAHAPIKSDVSKRLSLEFRQFLPEHLFIREEDEVLGFVTTEQWLRVTIKYIVAIAAMVSFAFNIAYQLFDELDHELSSTGIDMTVPIAKDMRGKIPHRLLEAAFGIMRTGYLRFADTRDRQYILKLKPFLDRMLQIDKKCYPALLTRAIYFFFIGQVENAIADIRRVHSKDVTWRYSLGFLLAYKGDIDAALEEYRRAFYKPVAENVITDTEIFISEVIDQNPTMVHLLYFRGLLNFKAKGDTRLAESDLRNFLEANESSSYPQLQKLAEHYLQKIRLGLKD